MRREAGFPARGPAHGGNHAGCDSRRIKSSDDAMTLDKARVPKNVFGLEIERRRHGYIYEGGREDALVLPLLFSTIWREERRTVVPG